MSPQQILVTLNAVLIYTIEYNIYSCLCKSHVVQIFQNVCKINKIVKESLTSAVRDKIMFFPGDSILKNLSI